jgi:hypothetical protein
MATNTGIACKCSSCNSPQWYAHGICQGCNSVDSIEYTWVGNPQEVDSRPQLKLTAGVVSELTNIWSDFIRVRGLSPYLEAGGEAELTFSSPDWYQQRGISFTVQCRVPVASNFGENLNRASAWTNKSLLVRLIATFEEFAGDGLNGFHLPNNPGMRELHFVRRLRNNFAHGDRRGEDYLRTDYCELLGQEAFSGTDWNLAIDSVLEPLWARLLLYAASLEEGHDALPERPGVIVATRDGIVVIQSFGRAASRALADPSKHRIGDIIVVPENGP